LDRELKYVLPAGRVPFVARWLAATCRPDPRFGANDVFTVYYDTLDQQSIHEKIDSDYVKTKVRVRWYAPAGDAPRGDAFVEVKRRIGDRREKVRVVLPGAAAALAGRPLLDPAWLVVPRELRREGVFLDTLFRPVLALTYRRTRLVEAASGARVSCDTAIRATTAHPSLFVAGTPEPLPVGVIEVKGPSDELPMPLRTMTRFGARLTAFSKYAAVWEQLRTRPE